MRSEETFTIATAFHFLLLDVRSVVCSEALLDREKVAIALRHVAGPYRSSLGRTLSKAQRQFCRHKTRYADAAAVAAAMHQILEDAHVLLMSSGDETAVVTALHTLLTGERWVCADGAYRSVMNRPARRQA